MSNRTYLLPKAKTLLGLLASALLAACSNTPAPPAWQANAAASVKDFTAAYFAGNTRLADFEFARAQADVASTGQLHLRTRLELVRCALQVASIETNTCTSSLTAADLAAPEERAYAAYLGGQWAALDTKQLPEQHRTVAEATLVATNAPTKSDATPTSVLRNIQDPTARLVAAGSMLQAKHLAPADVAVAVDTASAQGWRRPLLAWLGVQKRLLETAGDSAGAANAQQRIDMVLQAPKR
jgi:hypothetical protein